VGGFSTVQLVRPKAYFYFFSPLHTIFSSPTVSDTTAVSKTDVQRVNFKAYSLTTPTGADRIRVIVYGYISAGSGTVWLNVDGTDVASVTVTNTTEALLIDYMASIAPGAHTVKVDGNPAGNTLTISKVYIVTGMGLTSTTPTTIATFTLTYQILRQGDIRYSPGVRVYVFGNRKTTAPLTLTIPEATNITVGRNNLGAGDDNATAETILAIMTGSVTLQEGGEFTISLTLNGNVGATGDIVIVSRILARAQLRREAYEVGAVRVYERGVAEYAARATIVSVPGGVTSTLHFISRRDIQGRFLSWVSITAGGADVTAHNYRVAVVAPIHFTASYDLDVFGEGVLEWVQVVVWG
jgi:hypothetical protein